MKLGWSRTKRKLCRLCVVSDDLGLGFPRSIVWLSESGNPTLRTPLRLNILKAAYAAFLFFLECIFLQLRLVLLSQIRLALKLQCHLIVFSDAENKANDLSALPTWFSRYRKISARIKLFQGWV